MLMFNSLNKIRTIKQKLLSVLFLSLALSELQAQSSINASGGDTVSGGGSISYSLGQVVYDAPTGATDFLFSGVQLPYEIYVIIGIEKHDDINLVWSVFPNPSSDFLIIKTLDLSYSGSTYQMFDINGKLLDSGNIEGYETFITLKKTGAGIYFLKVINGHREIKTFKIIKK
jgi:hypothetical protein